MLYEIHDPAAYLAPDVVLDLTDVTVEEVGADRVRIAGARGGPAPATLKATVCVDAGVLGEAEISYAGPNAAGRARLAAEIVRDRLARRAPNIQFRIDAIGIASILGNDDGALRRPWDADATDVRLRFAARGARAEDVASCSTRSRRSIAPVPPAAPACAGASRRGCQRLPPDRARFAAPRVTMIEAPHERHGQAADVANARAGDKGNRLNIAVVCRDPRHYGDVARALTVQRVAEIFASRRPAKVVRYDLPKLAAFNFVLDDVLEGGVNSSLGLDGHGKSLSFLLLDAEIETGD